MTTDTVLEFSRKIRGSGGDVVPLHQNPYDLRPAVTAIVERIEKVRASLNGKPLIVLMGESHEIAAHSVLTTLTLRALHRQNPSKIAFGVELPYDVIIADLLYNNRHTPEEAAGLMMSDYDGQLNLRTYLDYIASDMATLSHRMTLEFCQSKEISTCFADAAMSKDDDNYIDLQDPYNIDVFQKKIENLNTDRVNARSPMGVALRNIIMQERLTTHLRYSGADTMIVSCGAAHVWGDGRNDEYEHSLAAFFHEAGTPCLSVLPIGRIIPPEIIPDDAATSFADSVIITGLIEKAFFEKMSAHEITHIEKIMSASGFNLGADYPQPT